MKRFGVTSDHLALLANDCLDIQPEILPCDIFKSESKLAVNKSYIINSQTSNLSGSHFLCVLIKPKEIYYFDSLAFPLVNTVSAPFEPRGSIFQNRFLSSDCHIKNA